MNTPEKQRALNRRRFLQMAGLGGGAALLAACGAQPTTAPPAEKPVEPAAKATEAPAAPEPTKAPEAAKATEAPAAPAEPRRISDSNDPDAVTFWTPGGSAVYCANFDKISSNFSAKNPGIKIGGVQCGAGDQNFLEIFLARVAAGNPPDVSIIWDSPVSLAARGALEPLDDLMKTSQFSQIDNWPAGVLASCQFNGKTYGLPVAAGTYGMYYNEDLLKSKGLSGKREDFPKTWKELRALSKDLTAWEGDKLVSAGFIPTTIDTVELNIWSALNGSQFYDGTANKFTIDSAQNAEMMQFFLDWINEDYKGDLTAINNSANWSFYPDGNGRVPQFQEAKLAMKGDGFWVGGDMYGAEVKAGAKNWNVAQYPVGPSGSGTKSGYWPNWMVVPKGAKKAADGFRYADYMSGEGIKVWFSAVPDLPTNKAVSTDLIPAKVAQERGEPFGKEIMKFFVGQLAVATPMWNSPVQNFANDQITRMIEQVFTKKAAPKDALAEAQKSCQAELEKVLKSA